MKNKLIKLLGGFTTEEVNRIHDNCEARVQAVDDSVEFFQGQLRKKDEEIQRLTNLMLTKSGFIIADLIQKETKTFEPINKRKSWPQIQKELEIADASKYAEDVKRRWEEKNAKVSAGDVGDAAVSN